MATKLTLSLSLLLLVSCGLFAQYLGQNPNPQYPGQPPGDYSNQGQTNQGRNPPQYDDQPGQPVARLSVINGDASVLRGDSGEWTAAVLNAPLMAGDSISIPQGSRAELQLDSANFLRIDGNTEFRIAGFDAGHAQIQLSRGLVTWRVLRESGLQVEISTPVVAVHPLPLSEVRVEVAPDGSSRVTVRRGDVEASTQRGTERVHEGNMMLAGTLNGQPGDAQVVSAAPADAWDGWNEQRDSYLTRAQSNRYVSPDIDGTEDLDAAGRWGYDPAYGNVWTPNVPPAWAPYREGNWVWSDYYGWTWVDAAPWGWAPYHYGSWYFRTGFGWSWFPGSRSGHYWYRPAMVSFFGFGANIGWIPLAPFEAFRPWYGRGLRPGIGVGFGIGVGGFRNAGFATGLAIGDFQRGAFNNRFLVNRAQLQQGSPMRGALPVNPTAANRQFSARAAVATGPRASLNGQSFYSRQGAQPMARPAAPQASGWQRFGQTPAARPAGGYGSQSGAGWDRFGSSARSPAQPGYQAQQQPRAQERSLQMAPQIVRPRESGQSGSAPSPSYSRP